MDGSVGGGVGKVIRIGDQPNKLGLFAYYNAVSGDANLCLFQKTGGAGFLRKEFYAATAAVGSFRDIAISRDDVRLTPKMPTWAMRKDRRCKSRGRASINHPS
jgi:hypothetical protein